MTPAGDFDRYLSRAQAGDTEAQFALSRLYAQAQNYGRAGRWLLRASEAGHLPSMVEWGLLQWHQLLPDADPARALPVWGRAAAAGSAEAPACLADAALSGRYLNADEESVCDWLVQAAVRGHEPTQLALEQLIGVPLKASNLLAFLRADCQVTIHRDSPRLAVIDDVLDTRACAYVQAKALPRMTPALVYNPVDGTRIQHPLRTNSAANLGPMPGQAQDVGIALIEYRMLRAARQGPLAKAEPLSVLRYRVGEEYKPHRDYLNPGAQPDQFPPHGPGQRAWTVFAYLSDVAEGGETEFPQLKVKVRPKQGRIVLFANRFDDGQPDPSTLHASLPVIEGEKWLATLWLREHWTR